MKVKSIIIEGMHNVDKKTYEFSDLTYLYGPNGVGKSTVMEAIQLALLGYIPNTPKKVSDIFKHSNSHTMAVTLMLEDNGQSISIRRIWTGTKSGINSSVDIVPDGYDISNVLKDIELPIFNFNEFIDMTANNLKKWFIDFLPSASVSIEWTAEFTKDAKDAGITVDEKFIKDVVTAVESLPQTGADRIPAANTYLKSCLSFKQKEMERAQSTIQSLIFYDDVVEDMSEEDIATKISELEAIKTTYENNLRKIQQNKNIEAQLASYAQYTAESYDKDEEYIALAADIEKYREEAEKNQVAREKAVADVQDTNVAYYALHDEEALLKAQIASKKEIIDGKGICPYTKTSCDSIKSLIETYEAEIVELNARLDELKVQKATVDKNRTKYSEIFNKLNVESSEIKDKIFRCEANQSNIQFKYQTKATLEAQLVDVEEFTMDSGQINDITTIENEIADLRNLQIKYAANKRYNQMIDKLTAEKFALEQEIAACKSWAKLTDANGLQSTNSETQFVTLAKDLDKYIQAVFGKDVSAKFNIEAKANSFSFGIVRNEKYIPYNLLSSGEKCMYTLSLMLNIVECADTQLKLIMVDDLIDHLDDVNVVAMFKSLQSIKDIQMIFAGVKTVEGDFVNIIQ